MPSPFQTGNIVGDLVKWKWLLASVFTHFSHCAELLKRWFHAGGRALFIFFLCNAIPFSAIMYYLRLHYGVIEPPRNRNWSLCYLPLYGASTAALESDQAMSAQVRFSKWWTRIEQQRQVYELVILKSRTCCGPFAGSSGRSARRWQCWVCPGLQKRLQQKFCAWLDEMVGRMWVLYCQSILSRWTNFIRKCTQDVTTHNTVCFQPLCA